MITTGNIDLSVGSIVGLTAASPAIMTRGQRIALLLALVLGLGIGLINGALTAFGKLQSFIVTLAALTAVRGLALLITGGYAPDHLRDPAADRQRQARRLLHAHVDCAADRGAGVVRVQPRASAATSSRSARTSPASMPGSDVRRIQLAVLTLTGLAAGLAGDAATRLASGSSNSGTLFELEVITAVVLAGRR